MTSKTASKMRKLRKGNPGLRHVRFYRWEIESPAYRSLSLHARCLLLELKALYNGTNNGELYLSVRTAARLLNTGVHQAIAAFRQLEDRGFVRPLQKGAFQWKQRHATCWLLTEYDDDITGQKATKDFMRWRPDASPKNKTRLPLRQQTVAVPATDDGSRAQSVAGPATDPPHLDGATVAAPATQIVYHGKGPPKGTRRAKAAWLREHLEAGTVSAQDVAAEIGVKADDVGGIADGKREITASMWQRIGALIEARLN